MLGGPENPNSVTPVTSPVLRDPKRLYIHKRRKPKVKAKRVKSKSKPKSKQFFMINQGYWHPAVVQNSNKLGRISWRTLSP